MKIRNGFVSNSSSSSFVCDVCGAVESGWDACLSDFDMDRCENDHIFCNGHITDAIYVEDKEWGGKCVSVESCPICNLKEIDSSDLLAFCLKKLGKEKEEIVSEIQKEFKSLKELYEYLKL